MSRPISARRRLRAFCAFFSQVRTCTNLKKVRRVYVLLTRSPTSGLGTTARRTARSTGWTRVWRGGCGQQHPSAPGNRVRGWGTHTPGLRGVVCAHAAECATLSCSPFSSVLCECSLKLPTDGPDTNGPEGSQYSRCVENLKKVRQILTHTSFHIITENPRDTNKEQRQHATSGAATALLTPFKHEWRRHAHGTRCSRGSRTTRHVVELARGPRGQGPVVPRATILLGVEATSANGGASVWCAA